MSTTAYMLLELPTPSVTLGPEWAQALNDALDIIDAHTHASGSGVQVPVAGLNIDSNLNFEGYKISELFSTQYDAQAAALTGASNANSVHVYAGNLYFTNGSGTAVQITSAGSVVSTPADANSFEYTYVTTNTVIDSSDTFVTVAVDTSSSRDIELPLASAVATGRIYIIKDATGQSNTNPLTLIAAGSDTIDDEAEQTLQSNYGSIMVTGDGVSKWRIL